MQTALLQTKQTTRSTQVRRRARRNALHCTLFRSFCIRIYVFCADRVATNETDHSEYTSTPSGKAQCSALHSVSVVLHQNLCFLQTALLPTKQTKQKARLSPCFLSSPSYFSLFWVSAIFICGIFTLSQHKA